MNNKERFEYYARSNGINPDAIGRNIKLSSGLMRIVGQRDHKTKPILVTIDQQSYAMPIWKLRSLLLKYGYTKYLDMRTHQSNVNLWFKKMEKGNARNTRKNR